MITHYFKFQVSMCIVEIIRFDYYYFFINMGYNLILQNVRCYWCFLFCFIDAHTHTPTRMHACTHTYLHIHTRIVTYLSEKIKNHENHNYF